MSDLIRDAPIGQLIRYFTRNKVLRYPEEMPDFVCPASYHRDSKVSMQSEATTATPATPAETPIEEAEKLDLEKAETVRSNFSANVDGPNRVQTNRSQLSKVGSRGALSLSHTQAELEHQFTIASMARQPTQPIEPQKTADGITLVDWYTTDDPLNPQNWSLTKKLFVATQIYLYTLTVYMGSAIYTPSVPGVMAQFGVSQNVAGLGLSMFVLAYGLGPLLWSPISEVPIIGRNPPYLITFGIFVILTIPAALVDNFPGLIVLRFLQGFFGSPCLATGGASLQDMFSLLTLPYVLSLWALSATCGPALGPIISGFSVAAENWRWSLWEMLWMAGPIWLVMFLFMPETSAPNLLLRRADRLRKASGNMNLKSQSEIDQANMNPREVAFEALYRPMQLMLLDPSIAFTAVYTAIVYGIFYSFFEAFPLVYSSQAGYGFNLGQTGLTFLSITVGVIIAIAAYWSYIYYIFNPDLLKNGIGAPERRLIPALFVSFLVPIGLFIFAWTSNRTHWVVPLVGVGIFTIGVFLIIQCLFLYLPLSYPQYAASLFAGNDFARSTLAAAAIHFSQPLFHNLGVGRGVSLLAGLTCGCIFGVFALYHFGAKLRAKSRFAAH